MKKASILFAVAALAACTGGLFGQETQKPFTYTFDKGVGTCTFTGVSLDQVWSAAVKALMGDKFKIVSSEKQSGNLAAERRPFASTNYGLQLFFEQRGQDICITSSVYLLQGVGGISDKTASHKMEKKFFDNVVELLYGKVEKK